MISANLVEYAVSVRPLTSKPGMLERMFARWFDSLVYNQIWEDPRVDLEALELTPRSRMLTIASGGCNVLNYLIAGPEKVTSVDINKYHIYLTRLRLAALRHLPCYADFFRFFGQANTQENVACYRSHIREHLDPETRAYWEGGSWLRAKVVGPRINYFAYNLYNYARLGYLLRFVHLLCRITRRDPSRILKARSLREQELLFDEILSPLFDQKLVRLIGRHPLISFSLGIPPRQVEALRAERSGCIVDIYRERVRRLACTFDVSDNYFAWQALARRYDVEARRALPEYLKPGGYAVCRENHARAETHVAHLTAFLKQAPAQSYDRFVLLDSQDWMQPAQIAELWREIARTGRPGTRVIFRTGPSVSPVESALPSALRARFVYEEERSKQLSSKDRAAIYGGFHLYVMPN